MESKRDMNHLKLVSLALAVTFAPGCYANTRSGSDGGLSPLLFATGLVVGAAIASDRADQERDARERERERDSRPRYQSVVYVDRITAPPGAEPAIQPPPPFDATHARNTLGQVDLAKCRGEGATRGYGHAKVTLNPSGDISKVVIDEPTGMPAGAAKCIGDELGRATVPVFSGSLVTVGTTWFVP
jgi:hypothetical protein